MCAAATGEAAAAAHIAFGFWEKNEDACGAIVCIPGSVGILG